MSDSVQPHRRQPTKLPRPWDSPGKNTGVGCHFLFQCMKVKSESEVAQSCPTQRPHGLQPTRLLRPWDFPDKSTGMGCHGPNYSYIFAFLLTQLISSVSYIFSLTCVCTQLLQSCLTLRPQRWQPTRLPRPWDSPGKNTGVDCHCLLLQVYELMQFPLCM